MAVNPQFLAATASVDQSAIAPFPNAATYKPAEIR